MLALTDARGPWSPSVACRCNVPAVNKLAVDVVWVVKYAIVPWPATVARTPVAIVATRPNLSSCELPNGKAIFMSLCSFLVSAARVRASPCTAYECGRFGIEGFVLCRLPGRLPFCNMGRMKYVFRVPQI